MHDHDDIDWDMLPGGIADETSVQFNKTRKTVMIIQEFYGSGDHPESVTLDENQMLDLVIAWCAQNGLTVS